MAQGPWSWFAFPAFLLPPPTFIVIETSAEFGVGTPLSIALAVSVWGPAEREFRLMFLEHEVVLKHEARRAPSSRRSISPMPLASLADAETESLPFVETVVPSAGESILTVGGTVSGTTTVYVAVAVAINSPVSTDCATG